MHERKFGLNSSLNISRKHKPCSDEQVEPKRKKCSFSYNYNSSLDVQVENKSSAQINNESERCFDRMLYTFNKNYSGIGQNQDVKLTCSKQNFHENSIFEEMIKEMRLETQPEDFPSVIKGNSEKPHLYQSGNIPVEEKKQSASNIFSAFDSDKNIKSVDCLSKYDNISNNKLNMKLYPVTSCNISLNENKENIYVDLKNKSILITNERQLNLGKEALLPTSQSQSVSSFEPQVSYVKNYRPQVCTTSIMQFAVDARENTSSQDKTKEYLFDQQKNVDCDKTCLIAASMDMTCLGIDTNKFDDSDVSNKDECLQSYQTRKIHTSESVNHENNESKIDFPRRIIVENSLDTFKSKKPERIFNKTKLFVEDMDMTCVENDILKNPTDASFCSSDVLSERDSEISLAAKDDEKLFPSEHNSHSDNNLKAETSISTYEYEKKLGLNKTCFFNNSMDMTCLAPNCDELDDSSYIVPEERVQNLKKYQTDNLPIDNIHCASENKPFVMNTTAVHYSENDTKRSEGGLDKTNLYANDMDMTCCVDKDFYNRLNKPSTTISDLDLYSEDSLNAAKQKTASNSSVVPDCVKQLSAFHHDVNSGKRSTHLMSELLYQDVESKEVSPNKSEGKTKLILVDMDMTCIVKTQGKDLAKQNIPTADLNLVPESVVNVTEHKSISDSILTFSFAKQQPVSQGDFKDMKEKDLSLCKSIIHGTQTNLFPVDMDVTCMHEKSCVDPSEQGFISTDFSPVSENFRGAVVKQDHNSVLSANFESSEKQSSEVPKFIFKDNKKENTSSCKRLSETRYIEDQSIFLSDCSPPKKYGNYEKGNIHSNQIYIHDDKLESLHTAIKSKISHSDMLCENVSVVNDKENPLHFQHVENLENFSQDKMHTYMPKYKRMDFNETHISDNSIDIACSLAHNVESDCNSQHNKNNIHNLNHSHSADFYETNRNASHIKNKPYINEETTPSISLNRPIKTLNQSKFCIENEFATNAEGCSNKYSLIESTHANSEDDLKHDKCVTMEQRDRENISSSNIESNNKMIESVKFANVGITYAIKQLKEMNKSPPSDVFKFPEVFFSLRKQPKPQTSFSCTRVELCEAVQNAIRQSSSFNYGLEELSFTAKINRKSCSVSISEQDKLDGKETPVDPSVNLYLSNSTFIPEYSENIENLRKLGTIDDISLQKTSQYLNSPQEEVLNLMSDSILDNSFVRNGTNSINFTVPPSLHENTLHQNTPTNSKFKLTIEKIVTPQSIKKIIRMEEEKLTSEIFIGDVSCKGTINPEIMITNSFVNTSVTDRVNSSANILKNMEETQTHSLSSVSVKTHQHVISNSKKSSISKRMSAERFKIPSEEENDSVSRNLNPQFEQLSEFDSSLSNSKDEVFLPSEPKNSVSNIDLHCENQVLSDGSQNCNEGKKENDEISNSKNSQNWDEGKIDNVSNSEKTAYHEVENNCVTNGKEYKQVSYMFCMIYICVCLFVKYFVYGAV